MIQTKGPQLIQSITDRYLTSKICIFVRVLHYHVFRCDFKSCLCGFNSLHFIANDLTQIRRYVSETVGLIDEYVERVIDSLRYEVRRYDGSYLDEEYAFEDWMPMVMKKRDNFQGYPIEFDIAILTLCSNIEH